MKFASRRGQWSKAGWSLAILFGGPLLSFAGAAGTLIYWGSVDWFHLTPPANFTNIVAVTVGSQNCLALTSDGRVIGWGNGNDLGAGTPPAGLSNVTAIASGSVHSLALKTDGTVVGWGDNSNGEIAIPPNLSNVVAIAAGNFFSMALTADRRVAVWGSLGVASTVTNVPSGLSNVIAIACGRDNCLAATTDGTIVAWGEDDFGQSNVPSGLTGVTNVGGGFDYSVALQNDGTVVSWGGGVTNYPAGLSNIVAVAGGPEAAHCLALRSDGQVLGWGDNTFSPLDGPAPYTNLTGIGVGYGVSFGTTLEPVIVTAPADTGGLAGTNLTLSAVAIGSVPWSYQWLYNGTNLQGQTLSSLQLSNVQVWDSGLYSVQVSNQYGVVLSSAANVAVQPFPPGIGVQPTNQALLAGGTATFTVGVVGAPPFAYQWYFNNGLLSAATNASVALTNITDAEGGTYYVLVTNVYGTNTSSVASLTVDDPPAVTSPPQNLTLPAGTNWILRTTASGTPPLFYQWQFDGTNIAGATTLSLILSNAQKASAGQYQIVVTNQFGSTTNLVCALTVANSGPLIYAQPVSQDFIPGNRVVLSALAYGTAPLSVQWWHGTNSVMGATNLSLVLANAQTTDAGAYFVTISNAFGSTTSATASLAVGDPYPGQTDWPSLVFTQITTNGFSAPTCIQHAAAGDSRLFIVEQQGRIWILQSNNVLPQPFLSIVDRVRSAGAEQGLLGFAVAPGFAINRHFYLDYTRKADGATVISRFEVSTNANVADTSTEAVLLVIPQPFPNHNGGQLAFGPDGFLYIGMGDGGCVTVGDPFMNAQNPTVLLGKILRIDVESGKVPYIVPQNNPFVGNTNYAPEIWALGLRNPWRFSFDRQTGDLYIGDVGQDRYEEIDFQPGGSSGGQNYGWRMFEGPAPYIIPPGFTNNSLLTFPVSWYDHSVGSAVIGGYVYRGSLAPRMNGMYFYGDFVSGGIWGLKQAGTNWPSFELSRTTFAPSTFGEDAQGNLYLADYSKGQIFEISDAQTSLAPTLSPNGGSFANDQPVTLACPTPGATIHYTLDGRDPTEFDPGVSSGTAILIGATLTLKVRAYRSDLSPSPVIASAFAFGASAPVFSPDVGPITNGTPVTITTATAAATVRYTIDGSDPGPTSAIYFSPLALNGGTPLRAKASKPGYADSAITSIFFPLVQTDTPVFTPASGPISNGTPVSITCDTPGSSVYYTLDGSTPTTNSLQYSGPLILDGGTQLSAFATAPQHLDSLVQSVMFQLGQTATPLFTPASGPVTNGTLVAITCQTPGAVIYYTLDGSNPTTNSAVYAVPVAITNPVTLSALAFFPALLPSYVQSTFIALVSSENTVVTTFAGSTTSGFTNALVGTLAAFSSPQGICIDAANNLYVADTGNNVIRKIYPSGQVVTFAGSGLAGSQTGSVTNAQFSAPIGMAIDSVGNVYVADSGNCRICRIDTNGMVSNVASLNVCGLGQLAVDRSGTLYVGASGTVQKVLPDGSSSTLAGYQNYTCLGLGWCVNVGPGLDAATNVYAATEYVVWKISPSGTADLFAGSFPFGQGFSDGPRLLALFQGPEDTAVDASTNVFVSDQNRVRKIGADGWVSTLAGTGQFGYQDGIGIAAQFNGASGLCLATSGDVFVADFGNNCIRRISRDTFGIGIPDWWQLAHFGYVGIDPDADPDHDGMSNYAEFWAGTDPNDPSSVFKIVGGTFNDSGTQLTWSSVPGKAYIVHVSTDLQTWNVVGGPVTAFGSILSFNDMTPAPSVVPRFYRVSIANL